MLKTHLHCFHLLFSRYNSHALKKCKTLSKPGPESFYLVHLNIYTICYWCRRIGSQCPNTPFDWFILKASKTTFEMKINLNQSDQFIVLSTWNWIGKAVTCQVIGENCHYSQSLCPFQLCKKTGGQIQTFKWHPNYMMSHKKNKNTAPFPSPKSQSTYLDAIQKNKPNRLSFPKSALREACWAHLWRLSVCHPGGWLRQRSRFDRRPWLVPDRLTPGRRQSNICSGCISNSMHLLKMIYYCLLDSCHSAALWLSKIK